MLQTDLGKRAADFGLGRAVVGGGTRRVVVRGAVGAGGAVVAGRAVGAGGAVVGVE